MWKLYPCLSQVCVLTEYCRKSVCVTTPLLDPLSTVSLMGMYYIITGFTIDLSLR